MTSTLLGGPGVERESLEVSLECGDVGLVMFGGKHQRWNTKPVVKEVESERMGEKKDRRKT